MIIHYLKKHLFFAALATVFFSGSFLQSCQTTPAEKPEEVTEKHKIGVLLVNHGSHSETWRNALLDLEANVRDQIMQSGQVEEVKTAFMEYTEPSIATRMKEFDDAGFTDVILVPVFLTVSPHTFEDIPTIIGQKEDPHSMEMMKLEKIERYVAKAETYITPLLDFTEILQKNVLRRVQTLSVDPANEGLVLIGYGDEDYEKEWIDLFTTIADSVKAKVGITDHTYGWCGHIAHYDPQKTTDAVNEVLKKKKKAIVIPVLVAHDEMFQIDIIGGGIDKVSDNKTRVIYKPDAILPDKNIEAWVIDISAEYVEKVRAKDN
ncbi:MAG: cobalamin biosynthesis protein CbiX [Bacteroidetes bacterium]|nr:cobalamin biosynthesis protein CbiX [Bacteroidota bacterium]